MYTCCFFHLCGHFPNQTDGFAAMHGAGVFPWEKVFRTFLLEASERFAGTL
jgi:hypothetical protein